MIPFAYDSRSKWLSSTCQHPANQVHRESNTHISINFSQPFSSHSLKCSHPHTPPHSTHTMTYSRHFLLHSSKMGSVSIAAWLPSSCCFVTEIGAVWIQVTKSTIIKEKGFSRIQKKLYKRFLHAVSMFYCELREDCVIRCRSFLPFRLSYKVRGLN